MGFLRFDPYRGFESLTKRMNELASELEKGATLEYGGFAPRVDIYDDEGKLYVEAEIPGLKKEDFKIKINDQNILTISGEKKREKDIEENKEKMTLIRVERSFGSFTRSFMLPDNVKTDSINAKYENGILLLTLDKKEPEKPKEFTVEIQ